MSLENGLWSDWLPKAVLCLQSYQNGLGLLMVIMRTGALNCVLYLSCHVEAAPQSCKTHATSPTASAGEIAEGDN